KKETAEGKKIQLLEDAMSKASTDNSVSTIVELTTSFQPNFGNHNRMRAFYYSKKKKKKSINQRRHIEIQKNCYCHKLC
ncbi:hypothetical protein BCV72DRAFT_198346, partial [Rhizopus microsporus var. microsporus]